MGSFSFRRADMTTKQANFVEGDVMKVMIPREFIPHYGAPFLKGKYRDYGEIEVVRPDGKVVLFDVFGFLAYINRDMDMPAKTNKSGKVGDHYKSTDDGWGDTETQENREIGIALGCYVEDLFKCKYPLKICSGSFRGTYETAPFFSCSDAQQGWKREYWDDPDCKRETIEAYTREFCVDPNNWIG